MKKDRNVFGQGRSDPYALIYIGSKQFKTKYIQDTVDPVWNYVCEVSRVSRTASHLWPAVLLPETCRDECIRLCGRDGSRVLYRLPDGTPGRHMALLLVRYKRAAVLDSWASRRYRALLLVRYNWVAVLDSWAPGRYRALLLVR